MRPTENIELKKYFKKVFENQEFETSFQDETYIWDGDYDEVVYIDYVFKYYIKIDEVLGKGDLAVAMFNVIITDIQKGGEDYMYEWVADEYDENTWYIGELGNIMHEETFRYYPISIYLTFYGEKEYKNLRSE